MRMMTFAKRNIKEIIRDPLNLSFLFGFKTTGRTPLAELTPSRTPPATARASTGRGSGSPPRCRPRAKQGRT